MLTGCLGISDTWQVYNLAKLEKELGISPSNPGRFVWNDDRASGYGALTEGQKTFKAFQFGICQDVFYLFDETKPERATRITGGTLADGTEAPTKADAVLGVADEPVEVSNPLANDTDLSSYNAYYTFGDPKFSSFHKNESSGLY